MGCCKSCDEGKKCEGKAKPAKKGKGKAKPENTARESSPERIVTMTREQAVKAGYVRSVGVFQGDHYRRGREHLRFVGNRAYYHDDMNDPNKETWRHVVGVVKDAANDVWSAIKGMF